MCPPPGTPVPRSEWEDLVQLFSVVGLGLHRHMLQAGYRGKVKTDCDRMDQASKTNNIGIVGPILRRLEAHIKYGSTFTYLS